MHLQTQQMANFLAGGVGAFSLVRKKENLSVSLEKIEKQFFQLIKLSQKICFVKIFGLQNL